MSKNNYFEVIVHLCIVVHYGQITVKQHIENTLTVAFNNIHRRLLGLPWRCSASAMYANHDLLNLDAVIRRSLYGFIQWLSVSQILLCVLLSSLGLLELSYGTSGPKFCIYKCS